MEVEGIGMCIYVNFHCIYPASDEKESLINGQMHFGDEMYIS